MTRLNLSNGSNAAMECISILILSADKYIDFFDLVKTFNVSHSFLKNTFVEQFAYLMPATIQNNTLNGFKGFRHKVRQFDELGNSELFGA